jgi:transcriptional regulator with XRE-family HTH domain
MGKMMKIKPRVRVTVGRRLRARRISAGFDTARAFAQALGVEEDRYTRWERAETEPDFTHIMRICQVLRITTDDLFYPRTERGAAQRHIRKNPQADIDESDR